MMPTIRIDDDVYAWLQAKARPFEDTPNSVLRRIAGLQIPESQKSADQDDRTHQAGNRPRRADDHQRPQRGRMGLDGRQLNEEWKVGARHALFSRDGTWYENLEKFPGALFDPRGYVLFKTEQEYRNNSSIRIGKKTNVAGGISSIPTYVRKG